MTTTWKITDVLALALALASAVSAIAAPATEDRRPSEETEGPGVVLVKDELHNLVHGFRFPIPAGWELSGDVTSEAMDFISPGCDDCLLRVMVSPGNTLPLADTVKAIQEQIASSPEARLVGEERIRVAKQSAYTLVKEEPSSIPAADSGRTTPADGSKAAEHGEKPQTGADSLVRTRYVTFGHGDDKFYLVLKAPRGRFAAEDAALEKSLARFRFGVSKAARPER